MHNELSLSDLADALDRDDGHHDYECETCSLPLCTHLRLCREHGIEASAETVPGYMAVAGVHVCVEHAALWMDDGAALMAAALLPCYRCGKVPTVDGNGGYPVVSCDGCYDGAPDSGTRNEVGSGLSRSEAIRNWNERMEMEEPFVECPPNRVSGRHVYAPLDDSCIHCQGKLPKRERA